VAVIEREIAADVQRAPSSVQTVHDFDVTVHAEAL
jgi:hypothetical protein